MLQNKQTFNARWADCDLVGHMRHSAYADYAAHSRLMVMDDMGFTTQLLHSLHFGPILFKEELTYFKEIRLNGAFDVICELTGLSKDARKWEITSKFYKKDTDHHHCTVIAFGAWIDLTKRKIGTPPAELAAKLLGINHGERFRIIE